MRHILTLSTLLAFAGGVESSVAQPVPPWGSDKPLEIVSSSKPAGGDMQILFHAGAGAGPFRVQKRDSVAASAPWYDMVDARVVELQPGVYTAYLPIGTEDLGFYRVIGEQEVFAELKGWTVRLSVSAPANGTHFVAGERPVVTVNILDVYGQGIGRDELSSLSLYMYGPQEPLQTVSAVKLLNASTDRSARPHHYIELTTDAAAVVNGNQITYELQPVTDEAPGTYVLSLRTALGVDGMQQITKFATVQIGTATPEAFVISNDKCAVCHEGTVSGKMYMHHVDPGRSPTGSWAIDYDPQLSCKACHNNDGYASFVRTDGERVSDHIVIRAHGVHMGEGLKLPDNIHNTFEDYTPVVFPADVRNCTSCHVDDRWKTKASTLACGSCHDNVWFGDETQVPEGMEAHEGGPFANNNLCGACHSATKVAGYHEIDPPDFRHDVSVAMTPPANGEFYVAGEAPKVLVQVTDLTGNVVDPTTMVEPLDNNNRQPGEWRDVRVFVAGPRARTLPVLTTAAANAGPDDHYIYNDVRVRQDPANEDPAVARTADTIEYQLSEIDGLATGTYTAYCEVRQEGGNRAHGYVNFQVGTASVEKEIAAAASCMSCHGETTFHSRAALFNPDICKLCHDYQQQNPAATGWDDDQYGFAVPPLSRLVHGVHYGNYLENPDEVTEGISQIIFPQDVRNCTKCHSETSTWDSKPSRLACLACHDGDAEVIHGMLMTYDPTPANPWSGDEQESCAVCHGAGADFAPSKVHSISNPYVPPYPRALREVAEE